MFSADVHFQDGMVLHQFPEGYKAPELPFYCIKWAIMGSPGPVWERDVCWLEYADIIHDEAGNELGFGVVWITIQSSSCQFIAVKLQVRQSFIWALHRAVNPPHLQILRIDREGMKDDVIMHCWWHHLWKKYPIITNLWWHKMREKGVVGLVTFDLIGLLRTNHIISEITMVNIWYWNIWC